MNINLFLAEFTKSEKEQFKTLYEIRINEFISAETIDVSKYIIVYKGESKLCGAISIEHNFNKTYSICLATELRLGDIALNLRFIFPEDTIQIYTNELLN